MSIFVWLAMGIIGIAIGYVLYYVTRRLFGLTGVIIAGVLVIPLSFATIKLHSGVQYVKRHPWNLAPKPPIHIGNSTSADQFKNPFQVHSFNPIAHVNAWGIAVGIVLVVVLGGSYVLWRLATPETKANVYRRWESTRHHRKNSSMFTYPSIELAVNRENGKPITIAGKDRFINTLVVGVTGTGKTSRILLKAILQDLRSIASGVPMDVIVLEPEGEFAGQVQAAAHRFGLQVDTIDLVKGDSTLSFNPFAGGDIADIIDNVRAVLKEQMGAQEGFFQNAQDDLVRTVIQVQVPLWPQTDFSQFAELVTDPLHFRAICNMIYEYAMQPSDKRSKKDEDELTKQWIQERPYIESRYAEMDTHVKSMVLSASRSFLNDTRTPQKLEHMETITKGLKIVVSELSTNPRLQKVLNTSRLPPMNFQSFLESGTETRGRVITIVTGNSPAGKLFGKLWLVSLQMYTLRRGGNEDTRRPVYGYIDEFHKYATPALTELFSQVRKYRVGLMLATQTRADLQLLSNKNFLRVVEANSRNKIYFPSPDPDDAQHLQKILGSVTSLQTTYSSNRIHWWFGDGRSTDPKVSVREQVDPRFRVEDLMYGLRKIEAVFQVTIENQAQIPTVGFTTYAQEWADSQRKFYNVSLTPEPAFVDSLSMDTSDESVSLATTIETPKPLIVSSVTHGDPSDKDLLQPVSGYVREDTNPLAVLRVANLAPVDEIVIPLGEEVASTMVASSLVTEESTHTQTDEQLPDIAGVQRVDLRLRLNKRCPDCGAKLELTPDEKKWTCPSCEYSRKNRK